MGIPAGLSADCQKFIYLTPKKLTQTPERGREREREAGPESDLYLGLAKIGLQLSCNYATTKRADSSHAYAYILAGGGPLLSMLSPRQFESTSGDVF